MEVGTIVALGSGAVVLAVLLLYNRLVRLRNRVESAHADLEVQLARRHDLIPNLVDTVKAYASHEAGVLESVTAARAEAVAATTTAEEAAADERVSQALGRVLAVAEAYPDLKTDERFRALQDELVATENKLAFSRQLYNDTVQSFRDATQSVPGVWVARPLGFEAPVFFAAEPAERQAPEWDADARFEE
ncbi:MAG TPA: LemA family protein [Egibacteraceae bacterium]|nr:LemA family protein [Egibacteraceae bacterium]